MKDYLVYENNRNKMNHKVQEELVRRAFGHDAQVLVAHHITYELPGQEPVEIPSADTLIFDLEIMSHVFGDAGRSLMIGLAAVPCDEREAMIVDALSQLNPLPSTPPF